MADKIQNNKSDGGSIEQLWYKNFFKYINEKDIIADTELVKFSRRDRAFFRYIHLIENPYTRIPNRLRRAFRQIINHPAGGTIGLKNVYCPVQTLDYLNHLSVTISLHCGYRRPYPFLVNSILRTVEHQNHLRKIGYPASSDSSHCTGFAADIEQQWYRKNRPEVYRVLKNMLEKDFSDGRINLVDYGRFWHICLNPEYTENNIENRGFTCAE